jgi:hypothetical protein
MNQPETPEQIANAYFIAAYKTKRWNAALAAMVGLLSNPNSADADYKVIASESFKMASAMLAAEASS